MQGDFYGRTVPLEGTKSQGFSSIYRNSLALDKLVDSVQQAHSLKELYLNLFLNKYSKRNFLGRIHIENVLEQDKHVQKRSIQDVLTYKQGHDVAVRLGSALHRHNLLQETSEHKMKLVGIFSRNRMEFYLTDLACVFYGITSVPLYDTLGNETLTYCLDHADIITCICSKPNAQKLLKEKDTARLKNVILCDEVQPQLEAKLKQRFNVLYFWKLVKQEESEQLISHQQFKVDPNQCFTFCYTSGTTGPPKCAMLSQRNLLTFMAGYNAHYSKLDRQSDSQVHISILPLPHVFERSIITHEILIGSFIVAPSGNILKIKEDIALVKPTQFISVPRLFNRIVEGFFQAVGGQANLQKLIEANSPVLVKLRQAFGGRIKFILSGSAPINPKYLHILSKVFNCVAVEGYGQTQNTAAAFLQPLNHTQFGNVGTIWSSLEFKLSDIPQMGYTSDDKDQHGNPTPRGQVWLRGGGIILGYYKDKVRTSETITEDGWLMTGDVGVLTYPNNYLKVIDRKKNIFKLSQGEYVSAEKVELCYLQSKYVSEVFLHGDSLKDYPITIAVANRPEIENLGKELGIEKDFAHLCQEKKLIAHVLTDLQQKGTAKGLKGFQQAKNLRLESQPFMLRGIVGSTMKLQRFQAKQYYKNLILEMYQQGDLLKA